MPKCCAVFLVNTKKDGPRLLVLTLEFKMNRFHAHIYIKKQNLSETQEIIRLAQIIGIFEYVELFDEPIGPHPFGMIELHFSDQVYHVALEWLKSHHGNFSVFIHQETGDDFRDHTDGVIWLGTPVEIDFSFFELIKKFPELSIH